MRVFISINLPNEIRGYLYEIQNMLRKLPAKIRWISKPQIHLTLKFFGSIDGNQLKEIKSKLQNINFKKFKIKLNRIGFFPSQGFIRIIWIDLKPAGKVIELQQKIDGELLDLFQKDQRFQAHLTLGRVKFVKDKAKFKQRLNLKIKPIEFLIDKFELMKSDLTKDGPKYEVLETYSLE